MLESGYWTTLSLGPEGWLYSRHSKSPSENRLRVYRLSPTLVTNRNTRELNPSKRWITVRQRLLGLHTVQAAQDWMGYSGHVIQLHCLTCHGLPPKLDKPRIEFIALVKGPRFKSCDLCATAG